MVRTFFSFLLLFTQSYKARTFWSFGNSQKQTKHTVLDDSCMYWRLYERVLFGKCHAGLVQRYALNARIYNTLLMSRERTRP